MQLPLFETPCEWRLPDMGSLPNWTEAKRIGFDVETKDPDIKAMGIGARRPGCHIVGISFAIEDGPKFYLPFRHEGGDNLPTEAVLGYIREQARQFRGILVGANLSYDLDYAANEGITFDNVEYFRDVQVADPIINELHQSYSLDNILIRHGLPGKSQDKLKEAAVNYGVDAKGQLYKLPARYVGEYAEDDAAKVLPLLRKQERIIDEKELWDIYNLESRVTPVLVKMRRRGVRIDFEQLDRIERWSLDQETDALKLIHDQTGVRIKVGDVWKPEALAPALKFIGIQLTTTSGGKPSIDKALLAETDHPVTKAMAWARKVNKLRTTFAQSVRRYEIAGRIHCTFNQMAREDDETGGDVKGARYGRLSSVHPNLQQQPARDEFAKEWRKVYIPETWGKWCSKDYSQQEPRWTTHFGAVMKLPMAGEAARRYREDPTTDNHDMMAKLTGLPRKQAKNIYLGLCYGEGGAKLCDDIGLPTRWAVAVRDTAGNRQVLHFAEEGEARQEAYNHENAFVWRAAGEEGQRILDTFDQRAPFIKKLAKKAEEVAKSRGFIKTIGGRRLHFPQRSDGSYDWTHKALNRIIQGSSADQVKMALVEIDRQMPDYFLQLQIHDEIAATITSPEQGEAAAEIMRTVLKAEVPFRVDVEIGDSWGGSMG